MQGTEINQSLLQFKAGRKELDEVVKDVEAVMISLQLQLLALTDQLSKL